MPRQTSVGVVRRGDTALVVSRDELLRRFGVTLGLMVDGLARRRRPVTRPINTPTATWQRRDSAVVTGFSAVSGSFQRRGRQ
jgi:hypothetical protein